ncbi:hypothetical protein EOPP23_16700 [Endozoicomonas sp. OPT23]|uniref:type II secretion system protein GspL n=1 Tax=Endozoicomonas sp. OPT23 TaxID=2072845 RepID=UPI00129A72F3|nr:type II secretion system protein GspL [Endozoicomonas sp. OPT23]MRI34624.1 hypothetical protein [Endozoicomonas sp. OPT23]
MKKTLLIRVPPPLTSLSGDAVVQWACFGSNGQMQGEVHVSGLEQTRSEWLELQSGYDAEKDSEGALAEEFLPDETIILLPATMVVHRQLDVSPGQKKHLNTALPFMLEEETAEDVESLHLVSQLVPKTDQVLVSAIKHQLIQKILVTFEEMGLTVQHVLAEQQLIDPEVSAISLYPESRSILMARPGQAAVELDYDAVELILSNWQEVSEESGVQIADSAEPQVARVCLKFSEGILPTPEENRLSIRRSLDEAGWLVTEEPLRQSLFEHLAEKYFKTKRGVRRVDLRSGVYQCPRKASRQIRRWKPLALVASFWLVMEMGLMITEGFFFQHKAQELWSNSAGLYLEVFPQDQMVIDARKTVSASVDIKSRMESRLKKTGNTVAGEPFLPMLQQVSKISASIKDSNLKPVTMDFNEVSGKLILDLKADSLEGVEKLLAAVKSDGLNAKLDNANQEKTGVNARMTIDR